MVQRSEFLAAERICIVSCEVRTEFIYAIWKKVDPSVVQWSEFLATDPEVRVGFPALPDFLRSSGSGTGVHSAS
jgi:hypothetical protein